VSNYTELLLLLRLIEGVELLEFIFIQLHELFVLELFK